MCCHVVTHIYCYLVFNYSISENIFSHGEPKGGSIITSGVTVWSALFAQSLLFKKNIHCNVIDILQIKPLNYSKLLSLVDHSEWIYIIEESTHNGGFSSDVCYSLRNKSFKFFEIVNFKDQYLLGSAEREWAWKKYKIDGKSVAEDILSLNSFLIFNRDSLSRFLCIQLSRYISNFR